MAVPLLSFQRVAAKVAKLDREVDRHYEGTFSCQPKTSPTRVLPTLPPLIQQPVVEAAFAVSEGVVAFVFA